MLYDRHVENIWPEAANDITRSVTENSVSNTKKANVYMAEHTGSHGVNEDNLNKLLQLHQENLSYKELVSGGVHRGGIEDEYQTC
jgi:hypothetical protein